MAGRTDILCYNLPVRIADKPLLKHSTSIVVTRQRSHLRCLRVLRYRREGCCMSKPRNGVSRRAFLKLTGAGVGMALVPSHWTGGLPTAQPLSQARSGVIKI